MERLQKLIAQAGIASRRRAEELIKEGKVKLNGKIAQLGDKATYKDNISIDGVPLTNKEDYVYYVINKPEKTITSSKDDRGRTVVTDLINEKRRIFPVGRLDWDTTGVLLLTNDGDLTHKLTHPSFEINRVYRARLNKTLTNVDLNFLNSNDVFVNGVNSKQKVTKVDNKSYIVVLHVGTYHHVKKLFEQVDSKVINLKRVEYAGITVEGLSKGSYRKLKPHEIKWLKKLTS